MTHLLARRLARLFFPFLAAYSLVLRLLPLLHFSLTFGVGVVVSSHESSIWRLRPRVGWKDRSLFLEKKGCRDPEPRHPSAWVTARKASKSAAIQETSAAGRTVRLGAKGLEEAE